MKKYCIVLIISILLVFVSVSLTPITNLQENHHFALDNITKIPAISVAQNSPKNSGASAQEESKTNSFPIILEDKTLFTFRVSVGGISPENRAKRANQKIVEIARDYNIPVDQIKVNSLDNLRILLADEELIFALSEQDAQAENKKLDQLANESVESIKYAIIQYREKRKLIVLMLGAFYALIATTIFLICIKLINYIHPQIYHYVDQRRSILFRSLRVQRFQILSINQQANLFLIFLELVRWTIIIALLYLYIPTVLSFFPWTNRFGGVAFNYLINTLAIVWNNFLDYFPNLFMIAITIVITYYTIRLCKILFREIERGTISIPGFYQDWAQPTYKLIFILILAIAGAIIFPYLPGYNSSAFRGISILIGALVTFGGASAIANLISGFILIYTRAFQIGDRIKIENFTGNVVEKTILSTRIRTPNNEIITIPNSSLIASSIINYSAVLREANEPVTLYTTITLGYDLSWRLVHQTLITAALATPEIINEPAPVVWQTSLDDFYVSYQLRAYTKNPANMGEIYSQLHQNIQDKCNEAGIEIMSPHYSAIRDGNHSTMPENYLPKDYKAPGFGLHPLENFFHDQANKSADK